MVKRYELLTAADPTVTRIIPELAVEIGLNESIMLLQMAFWLKLSNHEHDGEIWTYQSLRDMRREAFPYWSVATIMRTVDALVDELHLLKSRDDLNKRKGDKTRWYTYNAEGIMRLQSVRLVEVEPRVSKRNSLFQNETGVFQNETTLPETTTREKDIAPKGAGISAKRTPATVMNPMKDAIAAAFGWDWKYITRANAGMIQRVAKDLCDAGVEPNEVQAIYNWCKAQGWPGTFTPMALSKHLASWRAQSRPKPNQTVGMAGVVQWVTADDPAPWEVAR